MPDFTSDNRRIDPWEYIDTNKIKKMISMQIIKMALPTDDKFVLAHKFSVLSSEVAGFVLSLSSPAVGITSSGLQLEESNLNKLD